jgi:hypothetical protein
MNYKVVPFSTYINHKSGFSKHVSLQLEQIINMYAAQGWKYLQMETVTNLVEGKKGFLGIGAKSGYSIICNMLVFIK